MSGEICIICECKMAAAILSTDTRWQHGAEPRVVPQAGGCQGLCNEEWWHKLCLKLFYVSIRSAAFVVNIYGCQQIKLILSSNDRRQRRPWITEFTCRCPRSHTSKLQTHLWLCVLRYSRRNNPSVRKLSCQPLLIICVQVVLSYFTSAVKYFVFGVYKFCVFPTRANKSKAVTKPAFSLLTQS